jgi:DNA polymerase-3 subunit alpha
VIDIAERLIAARPDRKASEALVMSELPLDDALTYKLLQSGETTGVFQLESSGMQQLFKDLRPDAFEDVVAAVALYRPGPLGSGMVKDFVDCKHGRKPIARMHERVDDVLAPTYGVIVYQEQVMQIAQRLAGYTLGGADVLRRAMGKKKPEEMAKQKDIFLEGARGLDVSEEDAERIFSLLEYFAGYGFNKSHSAAYAMLAYQTGYLKAHYPAEFLCALLTADRDKTEKVVRFIAEGRHWGIEILPPDINQSKVDFGVVYGGAATAAPADGKRRRFRDALRPQVRFGLGAIRGVGDSAVDSILAAREQGPFEDLFDFAQRVDARKINRGVIEALVESGAFDALLEPRGISRARAFASIDRALERCRSASRDREAGQTNLFALFQQDAPSAENATADYLDCPPWDLRELLRHERQALGFYVSGHPLDRYGADLRRFDVDAAAALGAMDAWSRVRVAGTVEGYRERVFRSGDKIAFFSLEDLSGAVPCKARARLLLESGEMLTSGEPVLIRGKLQFPMSDDGSEINDAGTREPTLLVDEVALLAEVIQAETRSVVIRLDPGDGAHFGKLNETLRRYPGRCPVQLIIDTGEGGQAVLAAGVRIAPADKLLSDIERLFGRQVAELR